MFQMLLGTLLDQIVDTTEYRLYVVREGDEALYVGQSSNIRARMLTHARGTTFFGQMIRKYQPQSYQWGVDLYTVDECLERIKKYFPYAPKASRWIYESKTRAMEDFAEDALIHDLAPRYNQSLNIGASIIISPFSTRKMHPDIQKYLQTQRQEHEEAERRQRQAYEERQAFLRQSVCSICGKHDQWVTSDGEPAGVIDSAVYIGLTREEHIVIPLVCHDCNTIINTLDALARNTDRVRKVRAAIRKRGRQVEHLAEKVIDATQLLLPLEMAM